MVIRVSASEPTRSAKGLKNINATFICFKRETIHITWRSSTPLKATGISLGNELSGLPLGSSGYRLVPFRVRLQMETLEMGRAVGGETSLL